MLPPGEVVLRIHYLAARGEGANESISDYFLTPTESPQGVRGKLPWLTAASKMPGAPGLFMSLQSFLSVQVVPRD